MRGTYFHGLASLLQMTQQIKCALIVLCGLLTVTACWLPVGKDKAADPGNAANRISRQARTYRLFRLENRTADHDSPDALVHIPPGFDKQRQVRLAIFNHGLTLNVDETFKHWELGQKMRAAPANTVLILPEWAYDPADYSKRAGRFHEPGFFRRMLTEIMRKIPELRHTPLSEIKDIAVISFSGGFRAASSEVELNGLSDKISAITLLDSLYGEYHFDSWIKSNLHALATGRKQYHNFFFDTKGNSVAQYRRVQQMLRDAGIKSASLSYEMQEDAPPMSAAKVSRRGIVYKYTNAETADFIAHQNVVAVYFPVAMKAWQLRAQTRSKLATK